MLDTLFLHIGTHKTSTTSIQSFLNLNKERLSSKYKFKIFSPHEFKLEFNINKKAGITSIKRINFLNFNNFSETNAIISRENFFWLNDKNEIFNLQKILSSKFKKIKIICYIRRQDHLAVSHKQTGAIFPLAANLYGHDPYGLPYKISDPIKSYMDYNNRILIWSDVFGDDSIIIRPFEKEQLKDNDGVKDFCSIFNFDETDFKFESKKYVSLDQENQLFLHQIYPIFSNNKKIHHEIISAIKKIDRNLKYKSKLLPSKNDAIKFYDEFKKSNENLNSKFNINSNKYIFNQDFSMYPNQVDKNGLTKLEISEKFFEIFLKMQK